jgi:hypothetical protein
VRFTALLGAGVLLGCAQERSTTTATTATTATAATTTTTTDPVAERPTPPQTMRLNLGFAVPADGLNHDFDAAGDAVDADAPPLVTPEFKLFLADYDAECSAPVRRQVGAGWRHPARPADGEGTDLSDMAAIPFSPSTRCRRWRYFACGDLMDAQPDVHERTVLKDETAAVYFSFRGTQRREMRPFDGVVLLYVWRDEQWLLDDVDCVPQTAGATARRLWTPKRP